MIRLGLRLTFGSGREAALRVLVTAAAVALGVGLLLGALAGVNGLQAQTNRGAWLNTSQTVAPSTNSRHAAYLWWLSSTDVFGNQTIDRIDLAAVGLRAPVPPGMSRVPALGQYVVSPAMSELLSSEPATELRNRYPGRQVGILGSNALPSPNSLIIVIGHSASQLSRAPGAFAVTQIQRTAASCYACQNVVGSGSVLEFILVFGAVALLLPILILIATASRLSATRREARFAAMRLIGATPRQISVISAVEAVSAAVAGVALGFAFFFALRPLLYHVPFTGATLSPGDLSLSGLDIAVAVLGVPVAAVISARLALRRVLASPLSVTRRSSSRAPRIGRLLPLIGGIAWLSYFDISGKPSDVGSQLLEVLVGFTLLIVGLVLAGPWFTTAGARFMARRARRPAALIAGRRLLDDPKSAFRFISGLVIALFIASAVVGALSSIATASTIDGGSAGRDTLSDSFCSFFESNCPASLMVPSVSGRDVAMLEATPGVSAVTVIHDTPTFREGRGDFGLVACAELAKTPALGKCSPNAAVASIGYFLSSFLGHNAHASTTTWPTAQISLASFDALPVNGVIVATNGRPGSLERARTTLERVFAYQGTPRAIEAFDPSTARLLSAIEDMTDLIIVTSLIIAACSLAVNVASGLGERKRPFSLLRLTGVPMSLLRRVVVLETALPLLLVAVVSIAVGLLASALYLHSQVGISFQMPGGVFWGLVVGGLAVSFGVIGSIFPILTRITGPDVARNE